MASIELNTESVAAYKEALTNPSKHGLPIRATQDCFIKSETVTAKHILAKQYMDECNGNLPKIFCYIVMDQVFGQCNGKDKDGLLGYHLKFVEKPQEDAADENKTAATGSGL